MSDLRLTKTHLTAGVWEGVLSWHGEGAYHPDITVTHLDRPIDDVEVMQIGSEFSWDVRIAIPSETISDGVQTFLIVDALETTPIGSFALLAGEGMAEDIRAEMDLLRAELDMLKKAFRRHCVETA